MEIQGYIRNIETSKYSDDASPEIVKHCKNTRWKSIFSKGDTPTDKLVFGFCEITTDGYVGLHYHEEAEIYYILFLLMEKKLRSNRMILFSCLAIQNTASTTKKRLL